MRTLEIPLPPLMLLRVSVAAVWLYEGLWCKLLSRAPSQKNVVGAVLAFGLVAVSAVVVAQPVRAENCFVVRATADARNQEVSTRRSENRLQHYIVRELRSLTGKTIGPTHTHCIRNACESSAVVCHH